MKEETYIPVKDDDGREYFCPATPEAPPGGSARDGHADCVEKNVTERYSGNFSVTRP